MPTDEDTRHCIEQFEMIRERVAEELTDITALWQRLMDNGYADLAGLEEQDRDLLVLCLAAAVSLGTMESMRELDQLQAKMN